MIRSLLVLTLLLVAGPRSAAADAARPNLVVIQTDEHNFRTLGCYRALLPEDQAFVWGPGVAVDTPNLDWIAADGAIATRCYATSPVCTPSRAAMMTGHYPQNTGSIANDLPMLDSMVTWAAVLRDAGYQTGYAGKWHLDGPGKPQWEPQRRFGFEDNRYMFNRGHWKKLELSPEGPRVGATDKAGEPNYNLDGADDKTFTTDFLADRTVEFIHENRDVPFAFMVAIPDPHGPNLVRAPYDTMFDHLDFQTPATAGAAGTDLPSYALTEDGGADARQMSLYFGMVKCVDDNVGKILEALREAGVMDHTVVVFTSDHGDFCGEHGRDNKGQPMEASAKIPFLVRAPGSIAPGTVVTAPMGTVDFKPTVLGLLGVPGDAGDAGRDASALFTGGVGAGAGAWHDTTFLRIGRDARGGWMGAFTSRYKLVVSPAGACFFDREADPHELTNAINLPENRETVRQLATELKAYGVEQRDPLMTSPQVQAQLGWAISGDGVYVLEPASKGAKGAKGAKKGRKKAGAGAEDGE